MSFTHLHNHSEYSLLDGLSRLDRMVRRAADLGMDAIALTDHGNLYGAIEFYQTARAAGVKPIIGCEGYVASGSRTARERDGRFPHHLILLAQDRAGYKNLLKLISAAHLEGFYYRPRVDRELLERHSEGVIVLSGCPSGEVPRLLASGQPADAARAAGWYRDVFGDRYYLELMQHQGVDGLDSINTGLVELGRKLSIPLVATNDSHYVYREDAPLQDVLTSIQTNTTVNNPSRLRMADDSYYLKSEAEMVELWPELPEALENTVRIAESCDLEITFGQTHIPHFPTPDGQPAQQYLQALCEAGLRRRYSEPSEEAHNRLHYELEVIEQTDFPDYFLVVWDIFKFVNERRILSAVRGSAAASLVLYCLDVTQIDPLATGLVFERFLNIERKELPDIDMDFQDDRREEVIKYCVERYGRDHVAQIITFGTLGAKAAVRDVGRALGINPAEVDRAARLIPSRLGMTLDTALAESGELSGLVESEPSYRKLMDTARSLEGAVRHASTHAAGVIISEDPLTEHVPLQRPITGDESGTSMTQLSMGPLADLGLLKMDLLGLTNLTILDRALKLIAGQRGERVSLLEIPLDDPRTFHLLGSAETWGVFQLESAGMRRYVKELQPSSVAEVSAMIALYRPGPMEHISTFIEAKHGRAPIRYPHDALKDILEETYGVIVYQDQVLLIAQAFGGYTLGEADILRKAMGKKIPEVMAAERQKFIDGALARGFSAELATTIFELIEPFAGYAFNKAHSFSYAMIAYWTAYLKATYPTEYMAAILDAFTGQPEKLAEGVREARRMGIKVLPPDVNAGGVGFTIEGLEDGGSAIRFGMAGVKNVGEAAVRPMVEARESGGPFESIEDLCRRVVFKALNRRTLESLAKAGAFDSLARRGPLIEALDRVISLAQREARLRDSGQTTMFDMLGEAVPTPMPAIELPDTDDVTDQERALWERELLGVELSETAVSRELYRQAGRFIVFSNQLTPERAGERVAALGQVETTRELMTRRGDAFLAITLRLLDGQIEVIAWPDLLEHSKELWTAGRFVMVRGQVRERDGRVSISASEVSEYRLPGRDSEARDGPPTTASIERGEGVSEPTGTVPADVKAFGAKASNSHATQPGESALGSPAQPPILPELAQNGATATPVDTSAVSNIDGLTVRLTETGEALEDRYRLEDLVKLLLDFRGPEQVTLEVLADQRIVHLAMPFVRVNLCRELTDRLVEMLGPDNFRAGSPASAPADARHS